MIGAWLSLGDRDQVSDTGSSSLNYSLFVVSVFKNLFRNENNAKLLCQKIRGIFETRVYRKMSSGWHH